MPFSIPSPFSWPRLLIASLLLTGLAHATGVKPQTSVVLVDEGDGEGTISVQNTDATPVLLYSKLRNLPEDPQPLLLVAQPVARVEAGETQLVRFLLNSRAPLKTEHLMRVAFEGIPAVDHAADQVKITTIIRQDLPVIIHPRGLARNERPWQLLSWSVQGDHVIVRNDSPYVVRLAKQVQLLPQQTALDLPRTYLLPGDVVTLRPVTLAAAQNQTALGSLAATQKVRLFPASVYGHQVDSYDAPLRATPNGH
jgi:P pilus assembly chaperone PapD